MKTIAIEEHVLTDPLRAATSASSGGPAWPASMGAIGEKLADVGTGRLADMDAAGIDVQVLSWALTPGFAIEGLEPATGIALARDCNDALAEAVRAHPERFAGFATLPLQDPEAAAAELERTVTTRGMKGAMVNGTIDGGFLDDPRFAPVLAQAERLDVPIYVHPAPPPRSVFAAYFSGLPEEAGRVLSTSGWGWHVETGLHALRLVLAGVFDRFPSLQIIIGHMGENLPFSFARIDERLSPAAPHLQRRVGEYLQTNFHLTTSGYFTVPPLLDALLTFGADRILFAVDYPYSSNATARAFLDRIPVSAADREKIAHGNAERLLRV